MKNIKTDIEKIDLLLNKNVKGEKEIFGSIKLSFVCQSCFSGCYPIIKYNKKQVTSEYKCNYCESRYLITNSSGLPNIIHNGRNKREYKGGCGLEQRI